MQRIYFNLISFSLLFYFSFSTPILTHIRFDEFVPVSVHTIRSIEIEILKIDGFVLLFCYHKNNKLTNPSPDWLWSKLIPENNRNESPQKSKTVQIAAPPAGATVNPTPVSTTAGAQNVASSALGVVPATPPAPPDLPVFTCPRRPNLGREGRPIVLRANHFQITMPRGFVHHYDINIQPDKCPRKVNREIIETMVHAYSKMFGALKPVFDGRNNLYTRDPLPIGNDRVELEVTLPGEGKDRVFRVTIKWVAQVSLFNLEEALEGRTRQIPYDAILALDVVMRHLPSMTYTPVGRSFFSSPDG